MEYTVVSTYGDYREFSTLRAACYYAYTQSKANADCGGLTDTYRVYHHNGSKSNEIAAYEGGQDVSKYLA